MVLLLGRLAQRRAACVRCPIASPPQNPGFRIDEYHCLPVLTRMRHRPPSCRRAQIASPASGCKGAGSALSQCRSKSRFRQQGGYLEGADLVRWNPDCVS